jgi:hypothetical protein
MIRPAINKAGLRTRTVAETALSVVLLLSGGLVCTDARADTFNIEIDYMVDSGIGGHSHRPNDIEIEAVAQMFACQGHTLNIIVDDELPHYTQLRNDPNDCRNIFDYSGTDASFGRLKQDYYNHAGQAGWHYCIFAHMIEDAECNVSGASGVAEIGGDDFIVSLGDFDNDIGTPWDRAATLAHEFGHNLGLYHCGSLGPCGNPDRDPDRIGPYLPNLASIMSYFYQLRGVRANLECQGLAHERLSLFKNLDYSHGTMCTLDESALDEDRGSGMRSVDWDCSGHIGGVVAHDLHGDASGWCAASTGLQVLMDFDEWAFISNRRQRPPDPDTRFPISRCITAAEVETYTSRAGGCPQPAALPEACILGDMVYAVPDGSAGGTGVCDVPLGSIEAAHDNAPPGSMLFLQPGSYQPGTPLILDKPMTVTANGGAVIE